MYNFDLIKDKLLHTGCELYLHEPLSQHTTFKIGGKADYFVKVDTAEQLREVLNICKENNVPKYIIGRGSNLLAPDSDINAVIIELDGDFKGISLLNDDVIYCGAGVKLSATCIFAKDKGLSGLEFAYGIPGSVGGAVFMNAGAYGGTMNDVVFKSCHITLDGAEGCVCDDELDFGYRHSYYSNKDYIITGAYFKLKKDKKEDIQARMEDFMKRRRDKQPLEYPSAGSVFKRPDGYFAGELIQQCNLKGVSIGGAMVSTKHAGFIINKGGATCKDVCELIELIKNTVLDKKGVALEQEIKVMQV